MKKLVTMFLAAVFLLVTFVPVSAADWNLYGSARMTTFWTDYDGDVTQLNHDLQGNSRLGGTVSHGAVGGGVELGIPGSGGGITSRLIYGTVDLGFGQFLIGQHYAPLAAGSFISNQVYGGDGNMLGFVAYTNPGGRPPMGQLSVNGLKIALIKPNIYEEKVSFGLDEFDEDELDEFEQEFLAALEELIPSVDGSPEVLLPQVQVSYDLKMDGVALNFGAGFQTYNLQDLDDETLNSWMVAFNAKLAMMDPLYINFGGFYGTNVNVMGQAGGTFTSGNPVFVEKFNDDDEFTGFEIEDTTTYAATLILGAKLDTIGVEAGVGYRQSDNDTWDDEEKLMAYYLQATVPLSADGRAFIVPEVGYYDWDGDKDNTYFGLKWQVNF